MIEALRVIERYAAGLNPENSEEIIDSSELVSALKNIDGKVKDEKLRETVLSLADRLYDFEDQAYKSAGELKRAGKMAECEGVRKKAQNWREVRYQADEALRRIAGNGKKYSEKPKE